MDLNIVAYVFMIIYAVAIAIEASVSYRHKKKLYDLKDTLVNLALGSIAVLVRLMTKGLWLWFWTYLYTFAPIRIEEGVVMDLFVYGKRIYLLLVSPVKS